MLILGVDHLQVETPNEAGCFRRKKGGRVHLRTVHEPKSKLTVAEDRDVLLSATKDGGRNCELRLL